MKKIYFYSFCSAFILFLSSFVFGFWLLGFIAIVPYFYILNENKQVSLKSIFWSSFLFGFIFSFLIFGSVLYSCALLLFIIALVCAIFFGIFGVVYTQIKQNNIYDVLIFASLWVIFEFVRQLVFQDYDYTMVAFIAHSFNPILSFASIGGRFLVSFIIVLTNAFIGYFIINSINKKSIKVLIVCFFVLLFIGFSNNVYLKSGNGSGTEISFSSIQSKNFNEYSEMKDGVFVLNSATESLIGEAVKNHPDYIIYPFNIVKLITIYKNNPFRNDYVSGTFEDINNMFKKIIPPNTKFIHWSDTVREEEGYNIFDETDFFLNGTTTNYYQKRNIHPFYELTSDYFRGGGVIKYPYEYTASKEDKLVIFDKVRFGNLNCSELNYSYLARHDSLLGANIILSVGNSSIFEDHVLGNAHLVLSQLRATETNLPFIRSDMNSSSAFINKKGVVVYEAKSDKDHFLSGKLFVEDNPKKTIYTYFGDYLFISLLFVYLFYIVLVKTQERH